MSVVPETATLLDEWQWAGRIYSGGWVEAPTTSGSG
jgi:hypothetical protein